MNDFYVHWSNFKQNERTVVASNGDIIHIPTINKVDTLELVDIDYSLIEARAFGHIISQFKTKIKPTVVILSI